MTIIIVYPLRIRCRSVKDTFKMISLDKPQIICHIESSLNYSIYDVKWIPSSARFVAIGSVPSGAGIVQTYAMNKGKFEKIDEFSKGNPFKCGTFGASSLRTRHLATGDFKGRLQIWDLEKTLQPIHSYTIHKDIINDVDGVAGSSVGCGAPELATGSRDGSVMIWDVRQKNEPVAKMEADNADNKRDCWTVAFGNSYNSEQRVVCAGYDNGDIKMYDLKTNSIRWEANVKNGVCGIQFDRRDIPMNKLVATTLESNIHVFDLRTQHPKKGFARVTEKGHNATVWFTKHLPQNREIFMTAGGCGSLCLWKYIYPERRVEKDSDGISYGIPGTLNLLQNYTLSTQPISAFDWHPDKLGLAVCSSFDQNVRVLIATKLNLQ